MAYFRCSNGGGGGQLKETLLWENPSPSSDWQTSPAVEVTLSDSYQNYDFLRFEIMDFKGNPTSPYRTFTTRTVSKEEWSKSISDSTMDTIELAVYNPGNGAFVRTAYHPASNGDNKVKFVYNYKVNVQASSTSLNIPYRIYGLKYS